MPPAHIVPEEVQPIGIESTSINEKHSLASVSWVTCVAVLSQGLAAVQPPFALPHDVCTLMRVVVHAVLAALACFVAKPLDPSP
jgi:hypothetical protein